MTNEEIFPKERTSGHDGLFRFRVDVCFVLFELTTVGFGFNVDWVFVFFFPEKNR